MSTGDAPGIFGKDGEHCELVAGKVDGHEGEEEQSKESRVGALVAVVEIEKLREGSFPGKDDGVLVEGLHESLSARADRHGTAASTALSDDRPLIMSLDIFAKHVVHPERSEQNGVTKHPFQTEEAPDEDSS